MVFVKHGHSGGSKRNKRRPEYTSWDSMLQRCRNPKSKVYEWYGERGITVCDRWLKYENFYADMGDRPPNTELERKDNSKGYGPENCEWATRHKQMRNTRYTRFVSLEEETLCVRDMAAITRISEHKIYYRVWDYKVSHQESLEFYVTQKMLAAYRALPV